MAVIPMPEQRKTWTDERLDDLSSKVDGGFRRNEEEHRGLRRELRDEFSSLNARMDKQDARFEKRMDRLETRMDQFQHTLFIFSGGLIGALIAAVITLVVAVVA